MQARLNAGMNRPIETMGQRVRLARKRLKMTQEELAERAGIRQQSDVSKIENGGILQTTHIARLAEALDAPPKWLEQGVGPPPYWLSAHETAPSYTIPLLSQPPSTVGLAHDVSHRRRIVNPQRLTWEQVVGGSDLEELFQTAIPDDAMAPEYPRGLEMIWSTTKAPQVGSLVLVRVDRGAVHVREYRQGTLPGQWTAAASHRAYASFSSSDGAVEVIAVAAFKAMP